jgi:hypothetical protein
VGRPLFLNVVGCCYNLSSFCNNLHGHAEGGRVRYSFSKCFAVDRRDIVVPNGVVLPYDSSLATTRPSSAKSSKAKHLSMKGKEQALQANARTTIDFATTTMKKVEQIAQQNAFGFLLEYKLIAHVRHS